MKHSLKQIRVGVASTMNNEEIYSSFLNYKGE